MYKSLPTWVRNVFAAIAMFGLVTSAYLSFSHPTNRLSDFAGYYTASKIILSRDSLASMYDDGWFKGQVKKLGMEDSTIVFYVNPPPAALLMLPLASLQPAAAKDFWNCLSIIMIFASWYLAKRWFAIP